MYLLKKIVNLGRSSAKTDDDPSPPVPEDLNDDSSSKDENSTSQDVSELSESPVNDVLSKPRKFDSEDEDWLPGGDATSAVGNAGEEENLLVPRKFDSEDENWLPAEGNTKKGEESEVKVAGKKKRKKRAVKAKNEKKVSSESTSVSEKSSEKSVGQFESDEEQCRSVGRVPDESNSREKSAESVKSLENEILAIVARKFDSEDEQWLSGNEEKNKEALSPIHDVIARKFDSEDEQWLAENPANQGEDNEKVNTEEREKSAGSVASKHESIPRKFDSEDEEWLSENIGNRGEEIDEEKINPEEREKSAGSVSSKNENIPRKFDSEDEQWLSESGKDFEGELNNSVSKCDKETELEDYHDASPITKPKSVNDVESDIKEKERSVSRKFDSEDEDWLQNDAPEELQSNQLDNEENSDSVSSKNLTNDENVINEKSLSPKISSEREISPKTSTPKTSTERDFSPKTSTPKTSTERDFSPKTSTEHDFSPSLKSFPTGNTEDEWSPDSPTSQNDTKEPSDTTSGSRSSCESCSSIESSHSEPEEKINTPSDSEKPEESIEPTISPQDELKEAHQRNFAKALQDIGTQPRRRSVLLPDQRERVVQQERSHRVSESSTDGETAHDDGIIDFLGKENDRAEARLAARRQARVEAREIRMRELERLQKEQEETSDKVFDLHTPARQPSMSPRERPTSTNSYHSSRRSSEDSMEDGLGLRDLRHELKEVEEKFRKAMIANAQLDNEKAALAYQVELLKDKLEDLEEAHSLLGREHRERCREHEALKRATLKLKEELTICRMQLEERDRLIADYGLIIVGGDINEKGEVTPRELVSNQAAKVLESAGEGSLDVRLKNLAKDKNELADEVRHLKLELEEERTKRQNEQSLTNGPLSDDVVQTLNDYRFRLQKAEQETSTLQATVARLESQVIRYKSAAEESEKAEDELKSEKRKLLREHRESIARIEELETSNSHLQRRMDKLKNAKSTLLKEL